MAKHEHPKVGGDTIDPVLTRYTKLEEAPIYYWRTENGRPKPYSITCTDETWSRLQAWKATLDELAPRRYGPITRFTIAGSYVDRSGQHGKGRAVDLDQILWQSGRACTPYRKVHAYPKQWGRLRYLAVSASLRIHFRYVLDGYYNNAHSDHIHFDLGGLPSARISRRSSSDTCFIQAVCNEFDSAGLTVDGRFGSKTARAISDAGLSPILKPGTAEKAFKEIIVKGLEGRV